MKHKPGRRTAGRKRKPGDEEREIFAKKLRRGREALGLGQRDFAKAVGITQKVISLIENAQTNPTLYTMAALAQGLGVSVHSLLTPPRSAKST